MENVNLLNEIIESLSNDLKKGVTLFALKASLSNKGIKSELAEKLVRLSVLKTSPSGL